MGWIRLILACLFFLPSLLVSSPTYADMSVNITVIGTPYGNWTIGAPIGFTVYYVSDNQVGLRWTMGEGAVRIVIRAAYGREPIDQYDGYGVYDGSGTGTIDTAGNINSAEILYYGAWAQNAAGYWSDYVEGDTGGFMSISILFIGLLGLALTLTIASFRWKDLLLSYGTALTWMAIGFWWLLGGLDNFSINDNWVVILIFIPFILAAVVLLQLMNIEVRMEAGDKKEGIRTWTEYGSKPKPRTTSSYESYKKELRRRTRG